MSEAISPISSGVGGPQIAELQSQAAELNVSVEIAAQAVAAHMTMQMDLAMSSTQETSVDATSSAPESSTSSSEVSTTTAETGATASDTSSSSKQPTTMQQLELQTAESVVKGLSNVGKTATSNAGNTDDQNN